MILELLGRVEASAARDALVAVRVLVLDCGSITNPDATADMAALTAAMGAATTEDAKRGMDAEVRFVDMNRTSEARP